MECAARRRAPRTERLGAHARNPERAGPLARQLLVHAYTRRTARLPDVLGCAFGADRFDYRGTEVMKRLLIVLVLLAAGAICFGYYLGWFGVSTSSTDQKSNINISVDKEKIREDESKAKQKLDEVGHTIKEGINAKKNKDGSN
jgi:hypothetical protein